MTGQGSLRGQCYWLLGCHTINQTSNKGREFNSQEEGPGGRQRTDASPMADQDGLWACHFQAIKTSKPQQSHSQCQHQQPAQPAFAASWQRRHRYSDGGMEGVRVRLGPLRASRTKAQRHKAKAEAAGPAKSPPFTLTFTFQQPVFVNCSLSV